MDKMDGLSLNLENQNIIKLKELFPEAVDEEKIDFDRLRAMLGDEVDDSKEKYQFTWNGKSKAIKMAQTPSSATLRPCKEKSKDWDTTENLYIEGDNLEVLKQLQKTYYGKIKMIYIDPPYNTGNDFVYHDDFKNSIENYKEQTNQTASSNPENNGRFHTDWLNMMYPRMILAKNLLKDDGVIFISIDDNELCNLKKICDEVFGESNYINTISLFTKVSAGASGGGEDKKLKKNMEYILFYAKNVNTLGPLPPIYKRTKLIDYIQHMKAENKSFKYTNVLYKLDGREYYKTIKDGNGGDINIFKVNNYQIKTIKQISIDESISEEEVYNKYHDKIITTTNAQTSIRDRVWDATDSENNMYIASYTPVSGKNKGIKTELIFMGKQKVLVIWLKDTIDYDNGVLYKKERIGTFWDGFSWINVTKEGNMRFENGKKPIALIQQLMQLINHNEDMIVLDFFSGSATTAHAIMQENTKNGENIKFILVQLPEKIVESKSNKEYLEYLAKDGVLPIVTEIGMERIRRAGDQIKAEWEKEHPSDSLFANEEKFSTDIGFKVFKLDSSNVNEWDSSLELDEKELYERLGEVFKPDRTKEDILYEIMLKYGVFDRKVEEINVNGKSMYHVGKRYMIVCLEDNIDSSDVKAIGELSPKTVIFKESGFVDDNAKLNAVYNLEKAGVEDVKCI